MESDEVLDLMQGSQWGASPNTRSEAWVDGQLRCAASGVMRGVV
jgi:hypothetical protein